MQTFFSKDRVGKPMYMHLLLKIKVFPENMCIGLDKQIFFLILGVHTDPRPGKVRLMFTHSQANPHIEMWIRQYNKLLVRNYQAKDIILPLDGAIIL